MNLSKEQTAIVNETIGTPIQVLASAGSGKTRVLTERVRHIINSQKKGSILALTFTNKAAEEMISRLNSDQDVSDRCWIGTIHSIAQQILDKYGHTIGLPKDLCIYDRDKDKMELFLQSLRDEGVDIDDYLQVSDAKRQRNRERNLQQYMELFSSIKREMLTENDLIEKYPDSPNLWKMYQDYQRALLDSNGIDYDDILVYCQKLLASQDWIAKIYRVKYKHVLIDEAQDLNRIQYEFIKTFCGDIIKSVMMVGDPNQMIFAFNSSSSDYLCINFVQDFSPVQHKLYKNYRCSKAIIQAANALRTGTLKEDEAALTGRVEIMSSVSEQNEADWIVNKIEKLLQIRNHKEIEGDISLEKMVVIARNRFIFSVLEEYLEKHNIPYHLKKSERHPEPTSRIGQTIDYAIRLKINRKDWVDRKKLCTLLGLCNQNEEFTGSLSSLSSHISCNENPILKIQVAVLEAIENLECDSPNVRKLTTNLKDTVKHEAQFAKDQDLLFEFERAIEEINSFQKRWTIFKKKGLGNTLQSFRNASSLGQLAEDTHHEGLKLSTVHTMKGLEKEIVFLIGMCEGVFPDYRAQNDTDIEQERNSAFVAVTRAKRWLYITYPEQRKMPWGAVRNHAPSRFVKMIKDVVNIA